MKKLIGLLIALGLAPLSLAQTQPNFAAQISAAGPSLRMDFNDATINFKDQVSGLAFVPSSVPPIPSVVEEWSLNGTASNTINPSNPLTLSEVTLEGTTNFPFGGYPGFEADFSGGGSSSAVAANNTNTNFTSSTPFTFCVTATFNTMGTEVALASTLDTAHGYIGWELIKLASDELNFNIVSGAGSSQINIKTTSAISAGPHNICASFDGSGHAAGEAIYTDGALASSTIVNDTYTGTSANSIPLHLGERTDATDSFSGVLANAEVFSTALTVPQVALVNALSPYGLLTPSGTILARQTGFDNLVPDNRAGSFSAGAWMAAPNSTLGSFEWNQAFSMHMVVDGLPSGAVVLASKGTAAGSLAGTVFNGEGYTLWYDGNGNICFRVETQGTSQSSVQSCTSNASPGPIPTAYPLDIWMTYAGTGTGGAADIGLYVNGLGASGSTNSFNYQTNNDPGNALPGSEAGTWTMADSTTLHVPGDATGSIGSGGGSGAANPVTIDEFDMVPGVASAETIEGTFANMHWYQSLITARPAVPQEVIVSEDDCEDMDNIFAIQLAIAAHKLGYIKLAAVTDDVQDTGGAGPTGVAFYRAMLDNAGLHHVPVLIPSTTLSEGGANVCNGSSTIPAFNASLDTNYADYPTSPTAYRQIYAGLGSRNISLMYGGPYGDLAEFMATGADGISSQTGLQLLTANTLKVNFQGGGPPPVSSGTFGDNGDADPTSSTYIAANNGTVPFNWYGGTPPSPYGTLHTRSHQDPLWLTENINGSDQRQCWDCLPTLNYLTTAFAGTSVEGAPSWTSSWITEATSSSSNIWFYPFSALVTSNGSLVFEWFLNSMLLPNQSGQPRGAN